jgi:hypothetical protein
MQTPPRCYVPHRLSLQHKLTYNMSQYIPYSIFSSLSFLWYKYQYDIAIRIENQKLDFLAIVDEIQDHSCHYGQNSVVTALTTVKIQ